MAAASFHASRRFHPGYSWLGRWLRRRTDRLQGEALHGLVLTGAALILLLVHYLSWTLLHESFSATPGLETGYWLGQLGLFAFTLAIGVVGFRPSLIVTCRAGTVTLTQGSRTLIVPADAMTSVAVISARHYHRHERRYAATRPFIGTLHDTVLIVRRAEAGPVVIALPPDKQTALHEQLMAVRAQQATHERAAA